jgi:tyrosyl-tRNA synthetase
VIEEFKVDAQSIGLVQLMTLVGITTSNGEATRLINGGGVSIDQQKISDAKLKMDLKSGDSFILKAGKKKFMKMMVK